MFEFDFAAYYNYFVITMKPQIRHKTVITFVWKCQQMRARINIWINKFYKWLEILKFEQMIYEKNLTKD